jgi:hypothetical protein
MGCIRSVDTVAWVLGAKSGIAPDVCRHCPRVLREKGN